MLQIVSIIQQTHLIFGKDHVSLHYLATCYCMFHVRITTLLDFEGCNCLQRYTHAGGHMPAFQTSSLKQITLFYTFSCCILLSLHAIITM